MHNMTQSSLRSLVIMLLSLFCLVVQAESYNLIQATPDDGLQPRIVVDESGNIHLLYFKQRLQRRGALEGSLYYRQFIPTGNTWTTPVKVSSQSFNLQTFSISRAALAIDGEGRAHAVWYLGREAEYFYSRSNPERSEFEEQRSMVSDFAEGIDAGADVAAFGNQVAIVWGAGDLTREPERTVFARLSNDNGASFGKEWMIGDPFLGACACCSPASDINSDHQLTVAYRSAIDGVGRHMQLLTVTPEGTGVSSTSYGDVHALQEWELSACPLSTNDFAVSPAQESWLVFETEYRIVQMNATAKTAPSRIAEPFTQTRQKNPAVAFNPAGDRLVVWGEAIGHSKGGRHNLRVFDTEGKLTDIRVDEEITIPNFSFPAAAGLPDGGFLILY
ncbi:MAG TPA: hypothetical protein QGI39_09180 [Gammaproteobacteria bacterium]|nr:hypothetical protein [Gammaproteobacteria bacterium]